MSPYISQTVCVMSSLAPFHKVFASHTTSHRVDRGQLHAGNFYTTQECVNNLYEMSFKDYLSNIYS